MPRAGARTARRRRSSQHWANPWKLAPAAAGKAPAARDCGAAGARYQLPAYPFT